VPAITPCMSASAGEAARSTLCVRGLLGRAEPILVTGGRAVADYREAFVGIDVAKLKNAIAIAEAGREGALANVAAKHRVTVLRHPDQVVLAVPNRVAATLVRFHPANLHRKRRHPSRLKAWGLLIPYRGL